MIMFNVRLATKKDAQEILALYKTLLFGPADWNDDYPSINTINFDLLNNGLFVMEDDGEIIGAASIDNDADVDNLPIWNLDVTQSAELSRICIKKEYQNRHLVAVLLDHVFKTLKNRGKKSVHILVKTGHVGAIKAYTKIGFKKVGNCHMFGRDFVGMEMALQ